MYDIQPQPTPSHPFHGGNWTACFEGFRRTGEPQKDVARLSLLCAPYQGMKRFGKTWLENLIEGKDRSFEVQLADGQCARVFAVAAQEIHSFRIEMLDPTNEVLGAARSTEGFAIVLAEGALCVDQTGTYRIRVIGDGGAGLVAAEVWTLPPG